MHNTPKSIRILLELCADDTTVIFKNKNNRFMHNQLQDHVKKLYHYFTCWRIKINHSKSNAVYFSRTNTLSPNHHCTFLMNLSTLAEKVSI